MIQLTPERLNELTTRRGGLTNAVLRELDVEFINNQPGPWRHRIVGSWITEEKWATLIAARDKGTMKEQKAAAQGLLFQ